MRFVATPLEQKTFATVAGDDGVSLFVRFAQPDGDHQWTYAADADQRIAAALADARRSGHAVGRVILVGADRLLDPKTETADGLAEARVAFARLVQACVGERVPTTWRTRGGLVGPLPASFGEIWAEAGPLLTLEVGLPSIDPTLVELFEGPNATRPDERLRLLGAATARGISTRALLDPLVPMLTDPAASLEGLLEKLAEASVRRVSARYLTMTPVRAKRLSERMGRMQRALVRGVFADEPWHDPAPEGEAGVHEPHKRIPAQLRDRGHRRLTQLASRYGIVVDILDPVDPSELSARPPRETPAPVGRRRAGNARRKPQLDLFGSG